MVRKCLSKVSRKSKDVEIAEMRIIQTKIPQIEWDGNFR